VSKCAVRVDLFQILFRLAVLKAKVGKVFLPYAKKLCLKQFGIKIALARYLSDTALESKRNYNYLVMGLLIKYREHLLFTLMIPYRTLLRGPYRITKCNFKKLQLP